LKGRDTALLALITLLGLGLRLLVWAWREFQPLGGDEQEYLNAAVTLLRDRQYTELLFMRPPVYPLFLAASIYAVDSLVQNLRLVQAILSAATVPLVYLLTLEVAWGSGVRGPASRRAALAAALLAALSYTLAANAAELLTETLFLFGLTFSLWALLRAGRLGSWRLAALAGLALGALCLVRSVALPLVPLGALWLLFNAKCNMQNGKSAQTSTTGSWFWPAARQCCILTFAFCIVLLPWTARNYVAYGGLILIDTTGAENLWLDNDPAGREAVKAQLFALGDDRLLRQQLGSRNGIAAIAADPARFVAKAGGELRKFFALEYSDDMRARPAIWVRPADVWLRLILGDALWLLLLLAGAYGLGRALAAPVGQEPREPTPSPQPLALGARLAAQLSSPAWLLAPWALYVLLTTLIFHVELRYRLPLFPVLLSFAAITIAGGHGLPAVWPRRLLALGLPLACLVITLLHANYPALAWQLGWKHLHLRQAEMALERGDRPAAVRAAEAALARDEGSALAHVALARAALAEGFPTAALAQLDAAVAAVPDHALAHVVRGDARRLLGDAGGAAADLAFEPNTQQDLQAWGWGRFVTPPPARLDLGGGLDLGFVRGFHLPAAGDEGSRWTRDASSLRLARPEGGGELVLRLASGRPDGASVPVELLLDGAPAGSFTVGAEWQELRLPVAAGGAEVVVELRAPTFRPRTFDRASADGRELGVRVDWAEVRQEGTALAPTPEAGPAGPAAARPGAAW
jgi:hypothetical protein